MVLSDHLDMLGVELKATPTKTRKANGDTLQTKIKNTIGPWQAGKFMPLTQRPWSINSYALSKSWHKCNSIDLRVTDIKTITSKVKAWLYADQLEKPEELIIYRPISYGGLGLHHVQFKAQALLTRSFLETAAHPNFLHSMYHTSLFKYHVLQHRDLPNPGLPPFYSEGFFSTIRQVYDNSPLNVARMTSIQWYTLLLEDHLTMVSQDKDMPRKNTPCRAELASPENDWERSWYLARLRGIGPEMTTLLWRLLHKLLPTQDRVYKIVKTKTSSPICQLCQENSVEDLHHAFFSCSFNSNAGSLLTRSLSSLIARVTDKKILLLDIDIEPEDEFPAVWLISHFLHYIWSSRVEKRKVKLYAVRADLEARASLLRETRYQISFNRLQELLQICFNRL